MTDQQSFQDNGLIVGMEGHHHHNEAETNLTSTSANHHQLVGYQVDEVGWREIVQGVVEEGVVEQDISEGGAVEQVIESRAGAHHKRQYEQSTSNASPGQEEQSPPKRARAGADGAPDTAVDVTDPAALSKAMMPFITTYTKKINNEQWDAMFARLVEYKTIHGDCLVPKRYASDPKL